MCEYPLYHIVPTSMFLFVNPLELHWNLSYPGTSVVGTAEINYVVR